MVPHPGEMVFIEPIFCPQAVLDWYACGSREKKKELMESGNLKSGEMCLKAKKHLSAVGWKFSYVEKKGRCPELRYQSPKGRYFHSLRMACVEYMKDLGLLSKDITGRTEMPMQSMVRQDGLDGVVARNRKRRNPSDQDVDTRKLRKDELHGSNPEHQHIEKLTPPHRVPRSILSLLIDKNAVLPNSKVYYVGRKDHHRLKGGQITRDGISCDCCQKLFTLSGFEAHAGSTYRRPAASIVLEDGRSLLECQTQMLYKFKSFRPKTDERVRSCQPQYKIDYICSICHYEGELLLLCDRCPSIFHPRCLGLKDLPEGKWFCPSCRCGLCGQSEFDGNVEEFTATRALQCDQCGREYHVGCLKERGLVKLEGHPKGKWFCTKKCEKIFKGLHEILGKSFPVGANNLSWVILQSIKDDRGEPEESSDAKVKAEYYNKLNVALGVMQVCFEPIIEPRTNSDIIEDLIFSKWSELNRLNFQRFYTVILQQRDELISVATVRIHDEKVAEVPLIATCFQYRRKGMCRLLMNELEKKLIELGVERLVLPAADKVLDTWTTYFGFSKMTDSERLKYIQYTFLDFQDTVMCQKVLTKDSSTNQCYESIDFDRCSNDSEVIQEDQIEQSEVVEQLQQEEESDQRMECSQPDQENEEFWMDFLCPDVFNDDYLYYPSCNQNSG